MFKPFSRLLLACALALGGCTTLRETQPTHTATEELLMSHAAEIAAGKLALGLPHGSQVFVDASRVKGDGSNYAVSAVRAAFLRQGLELVADKAKSAITVELRMGALSVDQRDVVFGLPEGFIPIPGTVSAFPIPEISVYSENLRRGVAEFAAFAYDTRTRAPLAFVGPVGGERNLVQKRYFTLFKRGARLEAPGVIDGAPAAR